MNIIELEKLTKYYGKHPGIIDIDLQVKEGDFFGFIGPNGAGKSTTIRTLLGLISPTSGTARVLGMSVEEKKTEILSQIGYLPSETGFYPNMKVKEVLTLSAGLRKKDCTQEAKLLCDRLDLDTERKVRELSYGNRKKLGIICAMQHNPKLYIMDEPTGGLDPLVQKEFYSLLEERNQQGATIFLSSHILSEISRYCKTAAVISQGRLLAQDSVDNLSHTGVKKVTLRGISETPQIIGMTDCHTEEDTCNFLYNGSPADLLSQLSRVKFRDFTVTDPDLEEVFLHYYRKDGSK